MGGAKYRQQKRRTYTNVTVDYQADPEDTVKNWVVGAAGYECGGGERDESGGKEAFECPVVGTVHTVRRRESGRVIHGTLVDGWRIQSEH